MLLDGGKTMTDDNYERFKAFCRINGISPEEAELLGTLWRKERQAKRLREESAVRWSSVAGGSQ
jgi:hypothetical protein